MRLRPYQRQLGVDIRAARLDLEARGVTCPRVLVCLPTGGGKTVVFAAIAKAALPLGRGLIIAHREELVLQAAGKLRALGLRVGVVMAGHEADPEAPIQVCSAQTVQARQYAPDGIAWIIIDEAHHATAALWAGIVGAYRGELRFVLGFTATPARSDGVALSCAFDALVVGPSVREMIAMRPQALVPIKTFHPRAATKTLSRDPLEVLLAHPERVSVTFCESVPASVELAARATAAGHPIAHVDGKTRDREALLAGVGTAYRGVCCHMLLTEGWDCTEVSLVVLAGGAGHVTPYLQRVGRGARPHPGKVDCLVYDLLGVVHDLGYPDDDRLWDLTAGSGAVKPGAEGSSTCARCGYGYRWLPACPECGYRSEPKPRKRIVWAELTDRERAARAPDPVAYLRKVLGEAAARGWKPGAVGMRFRGVFARFPSDDEMTAARSPAAREGEAAA